MELSSRLLCLDGQSLVYLLADLAADAKVFFRLFSMASPLEFFFPLVPLMNDFLFSRNLKRYITQFSAATANKFPLLPPVPSTPNIPAVFRTFSAPESISSYLPNLSALIRKYASQFELTLLPNSFGLAGNLK